MSDVHLLTAIAKSYVKLGAGERIRKIKKLASESEENDKFIRKYFPEFYEEAFPTSGAARESWESDRHSELSAKPR
ncbi:MAG TPA: hypothetical protein VGD60_15600 [Candidatus Acidoferrales bacterium]